MGAWGTALYSNDISSDVRDMCNEVYPLVGIEEGTRLILEEYSEVINGDIDNEYADFWFALADWQWKHGILTDEIKSKAISLLEAHAGIKEWEESSTAADVRKRLAVMDKLLTQLKSPQPESKIPKPKIAKPKHKPGDIIIARTCTKDVAESVWSIGNLKDLYFYAPEIADKVSDTLGLPYEAYGKYIAILCVGTEKTLHSQYVDDVFDEHSVYAFYDCVSEDKPTVDKLRQCGFLPRLLMYSGEQGDIKTLGWTYTFNLFSYSFRLSRNGYEQSIEKTFCPLENERFHSLLKKKDYSAEASFNFELSDAFEDFFAEKARLSSAGIPFDNLLSAEAANPMLRSPKEIGKIIRDELSVLGVKPE